MDGHDKPNSPRARRADRRIFLAPPARWSRYQPGHAPSRKRGSDRCGSGEEPRALLSV